MYRIGKYTDDTRDSGNEKLEWKIRRYTIHVGYTMSRIHWILRQLTLRSFPQLKLNLHGKKFSDFDELRTDSDLKKKTWVGDGFNDTGNAYKPRETI